MKNTNHSDRSHRATSALMTVLYVMNLERKILLLVSYFGRQLLAVDGDDIIAPPDFPQANMIIAYY